MESKIVIPTSDGKMLEYDLQLHHVASREGFKIVFQTNEEPFERWLFYLLRDIGARVVTNDPKRFRSVLGLAWNERGVVAHLETGNQDVTQHFVKN